MMENLPQMSMPAVPETIHVFWVIAWFILVVILFTATLALTISRWGRSQPLRIFFVLSLLGHVVLAGYAATIRITAARAAAPPGPIELTFGDEMAHSSDESIQPPRAPWEQPPSPPPATADPLGPDRMPNTEPEMPSSDFARQPSPLESTPAAISDALTSDLAANITYLSKRTPTAIDVPPPQAETAAPPPSPEAIPVERMPVERAAVASAKDDLPIPKSPAAGQALPKLETHVPPVPLRKLVPLSQPDSLASTAAKAAADGSPGDEAVRSATGAASSDRPQPDSESATGSEGSADSTGDQPDSRGASPPRRNLPETYRLRVAPNRGTLSQRLGGSRQAEQAVESGLQWLASAQNGDGRWDASRWGAGRELALGDHNRQGAGAEADMGVSGLALLAFLGAGHMHTQPGPYQDTVRRGLEFLASSQARDGNLAGDARLFAAMYCHGMATFAVSEAYAMTGDTRLRSTVQRAVNYTQSAQHPATGGWRYRPGDVGDTSQLGWQVMALKSAEAAGIVIPQRTREGISRFLYSVAAGRYRGLAAYRQGQQPSAAMTAEALFCRQLMGIEAGGQAGAEASRFIAGQLPGSELRRGEPINLYFWYYAALALHQRQDENWTRWNTAMQSVLIENQHQEGDLAGSWSPQTVWGRHGGRVYTTALATLCLEVYYRYQANDQIPNPKSQ